MAHQHVISLQKKFEISQSYLIARTSFTFEWNRSSQLNSKNNTENCSKCQKWIKNIEKRSFMWSQTLKTTRCYITIAHRFIEISVNGFSTRKRIPLVPSSCFSLNLSFLDFCLFLRLENHLDGHHIEALKNIKICIWSTEDYFSHAMRRKKTGFPKKFFLRKILLNCNLLKNYKKKSQCHYLI